MLFNFALGTLLGGIAFALLIQEWIRYHRWRKAEERSPLYSPQMFLRRAVVSLLMLGFIATVRMQPIVLENASARRAGLYLLLYLVIILSIFLFAALDFRQNRKIANILEHQMSEYQALSLGLIAKMQEKEQDEHKTGSARESSNPE